MTKSQQGPKWGGVGDAAVRKRTGKGWEEWLRIIDAAGGPKLTHQEIVKVVRTREVGPWWEQMITVGYEQARGKREKHERPDGFQISRTRTYPVPVDRLYAAFKDPRKRAAWLAEMGLRVRTSKQDASMRLSWKDGRSVLDLSFTAAGPRKSRVTVQHEKLLDAAEAARMKAYWGDRLDALGQHLQRGRDA